MSSYYSKRIKSRQIKNAKEKRTRRGNNNRKNYRKSFSGGGHCSEEFYSPSTNKFGSAQSRKTATFLRLCKNGDETSIELISTSKISKANITRGFEIAMTFGHTQLVRRFIEHGVTDYFSFQPVKIHPSLDWSGVLGHALNHNNLRFYEWFVTQELSQGHITDKFFFQEVFDAIHRDDPSALKILLRCHPDPTFILDFENLVLTSVVSGGQSTEILLEYEAKVTQEAVDIAIEDGLVTVLDQLLKIGGVEPKHSELPLPCLLDTNRCEDAILTPKELNVVRTLLKYGADLQERAGEMNLLHSAAGHVDENDRYVREVVDFIFEYMFEFDYAEKFNGFMVVDLLPKKYKEGYQDQMVRRIEVVREIVCEFGKVPWDCATIVAVCLHGETVRMLSLM